MTPSADPVQAPPKVSNWDRIHSREAALNRLEWLAAGVDRHRARLDLCATAAGTKKLERILLFRAGIAAGAALALHACGQLEDGTFQQLWIRIHEALAPRQVAVPPLHRGR